MSLAGRYRGLVCDLDGVVYRGLEPVPHAVTSLREPGLPLVYATNNAARTPDDVAAHLAALGLDCRPSDVATSSEAAAWLLRERTTGRARVLAVGGPGVAVALEGKDFTAVTPPERAQGEGADLVAVVQGYGPSVTAADLAEAAYAVQGGALWIATNTDATLPTDRGVAPGNGSLVAAVARALGRGPDVVAGKPEPPLYLLAAERLHEVPDGLLAIGDRLDTDIAGAVSAGLDSLLVLTGVDDLEAVLAAPAGQRPRFVAPDLRWLNEQPDLVDEVASLLHSAYRAMDDARDSAVVRDLQQKVRVRLSEPSPR